MDDQTMAPKRKNSDDSNAPAPKKPKKNSEPIQVNWAIPKSKRKATPDEDLKTTYAEALYDRTSDEVDTLQPPLKAAPHRSPIYQNPAADLAASAPNRPSAALRSLFNEIKNQSTSNTESGYRLGALEQHFKARDVNNALALSRAEDEEILVLDKDRRLEVTVNDETAHVDLNRRLPSEGNRHGYFIELPPGTTVTVNGQTYTNNDDDESASSPFYIGPLETYTIIELLSQPVFFFRNQGSLRVTATTKPQVSDEELNRRDQNGDVDVADTTVRWIDIEAPQEGSASGAKSPEAPQVGGGQEPQNDKGTQTSTPGPQVETVKTPPVKPVQTPETEDIEFSDAWTDEGAPIEDP
ncbi:hypothetical protein BDW02DRAFT_74775 [Decorospora gaudefroyi]|uniref:Uncharacterized protein n=1 Tax=Decorospora gaudefroyi TaxID=184978 RepID=A0A6A5K2G3_9PLEO|nr:hypothetical protein BDW02DRAFT_74775 [Decorospora gaudefroyi]